MKTELILPKLIAIGGNEWNAGNHRRVYFNNLPKWYGLEISRYGTGNISYAKLNGEKISNGKARKLIAIIDSGKLFYDVNNGSWMAEGYAFTSEYFLPIIENIGRKAGLGE